MTPDTPSSDHPPKDRGDAQRSEREANPPPPAEEALTAEDVHDSPQLPPERLRTKDPEDG